ncbi:IS4 family transposase [uncultured Methanolobus sp.]|uniref:IS4 family transposase n=1 Tax=uncultured Methanolobus sp. TaxID=218300 RepID=UPI002AABFB2E|nr:IS4 family transposase [uncultured Methanolobus sp.]
MTNDPQIIEKNLCSIFPPDWLRQTAHETGLVKRERKIDPVIMFWVLTLGFGVQLQHTLASLKRSYEKAATKKISDGSWYERFTPELVAFLQACVMHGIEQLTQEQNKHLSEKLSQFEDVLIQNSSIVRLHSSLSEKWPAARIRTVAAGVKVGLLVSAIANEPKNVALYAESTNELKTLRMGPWIKNRILLIDLGFYKHQLFARIQDNGGYFVSRLKNNADPLIVNVNSTHRGRSIDVKGKCISEVLPHLKRQVLDADVEISFKRRDYNGKQKNDSEMFRMIAIMNKETEKYHTYITNIPSDVLDAEDIAKLYGARWDIELVFKELKSRYAMDVVNTTNKNIVEAYIWIAMLTLLVSRRIYTIVRSNNEKEMKLRYTQLRWSTIFSENANNQLRLILKYCGIEMSLEMIMEVYSSQALDPHVNRQRFREEWWA